VDVIHAAETYFGFSLQSARAARKMGRPLVVTVKQTIPEVEQLHPLRRLGRDRLVKEEVRQAAALFIAVSRSAAAALRQEGVPPDRIEVVPPAVDVSSFTRADRSSSETFRVLFVGPALWRKGLLEAVRALALVRQTRPAQLTIVGDGPDLPRALHIAEAIGVRDAIQIVKWTPHAKMVRHYLDADVLLAPSIPTRTWQEQDSLAVLEGMAAGLPVVATASGVRLDMLGDEAYWVAPGDFLDISERLLEIASSPTEAFRRGQVLHARARERHDVSVVGARLASCYRRIGIAESAGSTKADPSGPGERDQGSG
jgi:glycosyltransferase involved in cell wall biosynthesis